MIACVLDDGARTYERKVAYEDIPLLKKAGYTVQKIYGKNTAKNLGNCPVCNRKLPKSKGGQRALCESCQEELL